MTTRSLQHPVATRMRRPQANRVASSDRLVLSFYIASFLNMLLSSGLMSNWNVSPIIVMGAQAIPAALLFLTPTPTRTAKPELNKPILLVSGAIIAASLIAIFYTVRNSPDIIAQAASNTGLFLLAAVGVVGFNVWDARRRFGQWAAARLTTAFYFSCITFCGLQAALLLSGVSNPVGDLLPQLNGDAVLAKYLGFRNLRQILPISSSLQGGAVVPLATCVMAAANMTLRRFKSLDAGAMLCGLFLLILLDVQQILLSVFTSAAAVIMLRDGRRYGIVASIVPWTYVLFALFGRAFFPFLLDLANLRGFNRFGLFSGREFIWQRFWEYLERADLSQFLIGNGAFGQSGSRLAETYAVMFASFTPEMRSLATLHNSYLQITVDTGVLGLALVMVLISLTAGRARNLAHGAGPDALAMRRIAMVVLAIALAGASEVAFTIYMKEAVGIIVFSVAMVAISARSALPSAGRARERKQRFRMRALQR